MTAGFNSARMFRTFSAAEIAKLCEGIPKEDCTAGKLQDARPELSRQLLNTVFKTLPVLFGATFTYGRNKFPFFDASGTRQAPVERNDVEVEGRIGLLVNNRTNTLSSATAQGRYDSGPVIPYCLETDSLELQPLSLAVAFDDDRRALARRRDGSHIRRRED